MIKLRPLVSTFLSRMSKQSPYATRLALPKWDKAVPGDQGDLWPSVCVATGAIKPKLNFENFRFLVKISILVKVFEKTRFCQKFRF